MGSTVKKIALLSGGGDCPGLNAVIRTITKTAISKYGYEVIGFVYGYRGLYHNNYVHNRPYSNTWLKFHLYYSNAPSLPLE